MDSEIIRKARQANLAQYLLSVGVPLVRNGHRYKHKEHDSLVFTKNAYFWNSQQEHGNAIDYLVRHMDMDFVSAVSALTTERIPSPSQPPPTSKPFESNLNCDKIMSYLNQTRHINNGVIDLLIEKKLLLQEAQTNNAIFPMRDENNNIVGAELHGVTAKRFKGIKAGSKHGYGFNVRLSNDDTFDYALFFESALDLLSFMDYKINFEGKTLERCILISMAGLKMNVLMHMLKIFDGSPQAVLCVDNDPAGRAFKNKVANAKIPYIDRPPHSDFKDWNEQLMHMKKHSKPIQRLLNRGSYGNQELSDKTR